MPPVTIQVSVKGAKEAAAVIDRMRKRLEDPQEFFKRDVVKMLADDFRTAFASQGASQGSAWKPRKAQTQSRYRREKRYSTSPRVLEASGRMRSLLVNPQPPQTKIRTTPTMLRYGINTTRGQASSKRSGGAGYAWYVSKSRPFARANANAHVFLAEKMRDYLITDV